jgi:hypothetical protein
MNNGIINSVGSIPQFASEIVAEDARSTTDFMSPVRVLDSIYNVCQIDLGASNTNTSGQAAWTTSFSGAVNVQVGSASVAGGGNILAYHYGFGSTTLPKWNGSTGNFCGRYTNWGRRQRFKMRLGQTNNAAISANTTYRFLLGKTTFGVANIGQLAVRGMGFEVRGGGALWLTTHNGTARTDTNTNFTLGVNITYEIIVESNGFGEAMIFLDGRLIASSSGAPTTSPTDFASQAFVIEATTTDQSVSFIGLDRFLQVLRP